MNEFATNVPPAGNLFGHPPPVDRRTGAILQGPRVNTIGSDRPHRQPTADELTSMSLAGEFKLRCNSSMSVEDLASIGAPRLKELLDKLDASSGKPREFQPYSLNDVDGDEGAMLRLVSDVVSLVRGASVDTMKALGREKLLDLRKRLTPAPTPVVGNSSDDWAGYSLNSFLDE